MQGQGKASKPFPEKASVGTGKPCCSSGPLAASLRRDDRSPKSLGPNFFAFYLIMEHKLFDGSNFLFGMHVGHAHTIPRGTENI